MSTSPFLPADDPRSGRCGSCGAALAPDQRYCLSCGARREHGRLPFQDALQAPTMQSPGGAYGSVPPALWAGPPQGPAFSTATLLSALACVLIAFGVGILVGGGGGDDPQPVVIGGAPAAAAAAPVATTTTDTTAAAAEEDVPDDDAGAEDGTNAKAADTVPKRKLNATEKAEAEEIAKTPAKAPKAKAIDQSTAAALDSKDPDKAREASQSLPDVVSTGD
jgi:hypothetical protein